jgi:formate hydrogenlyase subunit 4
MEHLYSLISVVVAPFVGGLLMGIDRKLTARMQGRIGPSIMQPFYDFLKLWGKEPIITSKIPLLWVFGYLGMMITSIVLLAAKQDLLMLVFVLGFGGVCLALGSLSIRSPYSQLGGNRQLLQMLAYEPILLFVAVAIYLKAGSFLIQGTFDSAEPLLPYLPLAFVALFIALVIKVRKSPFDISASEHAHQELVRGVYTEYSRPFLALIELTHWYELVLLSSLVTLFWITPVWIGILIAPFVFFLVLITDNITARLTWSRMLAISLGCGFGLTLINVVGLTLLGG